MTLAMSTCDFSNRVEVITSKAGAVAPAKFAYWKGFSVVADDLRNS